MPVAPHQQVQGTDAQVEAIEDGIAGEEHPQRDEPEDVQVKHQTPACRDPPSAGPGLDGVGSRGWRIEATSSSDPGLGGATSPGPAAGGPCWILA